MNIFAFILITGFIVKSIFILIESLIYKLSLQNDTQAISPALHAAHVDIGLEMNTEMKIEAVSNSLKPVGKQIYMRTVSLSKVQ
jgi:uncharacterized membrane protein